MLLATLLTLSWAPSPPGPLAAAAPVALAATRQDEDEKKGKRRRQGKKRRRDSAPEPDVVLRDHVDIACPEAADWRDLSRSVVRIIAFNQKCTGVLLNNTAEDGTPYVLTARHCGNLSNATFYLGWARPGCGEGEPPEEPLTLQGSTLVYADPLLDLQLLRLRKTPPLEFDVLYAGWNLSGEVPESVACLHHPGGDVMKFSHDADPPRPQSSNWRIHSWDVGRTEQGSSGAPLFDHEQRVIGQLQGGLVPDSRDGPSAAGDLFGRADRAWPELAPFLDPLGVGRKHCDAFDPENPWPEFALRAVEPSPVPAGTALVVVRGVSLPAQATLSLDGVEQPRGSFRTLSNSHCEVVLPADLAPGTHTLKINDFEAQLERELAFEVLAAPPKD